MDVSTGLQKDFSSWVRATHDPSECRLGVDGFRYEDLFEPARLEALTGVFEAYFKQEDATAWEAFDKYRASKGEGMKPEQTSDALLGAAPVLARFVAKLFGVEPEYAAQLAAAKEREVLWFFKKDFAKKRLFKASAGKAWTASGGLIQGLRADTTFYAFVVYTDADGKLSKPSTSFKFQLQDKFGYK